ncbi:MAG: hypothetical protein F4087_06380 [Gemmatimonadetes bacterium]|nr:hypothetical protein [Gemmatimonadota bacterium]MYE71423.1 hypothetical protein [Gemmatimonadota bacterium]MYJ68122.1 hypothetical protein [Gemmatimonadota bacterium]
MTDALTRRLSILAWLIAATACDSPAETGARLPGGVSFLERDSAGIVVATTLGTRARAPVGWVVDTVPEYQIGEVGGEDPYLFSRIEGVQQLSDGRVVVLDRANCELRFFGRDGVFLEQKGGIGEGPGEFQPRSFCDLESSPGNDSLYVHSLHLRSTVSFFDDHGRFSHRVRGSWDGQDLWRVHGVAGGRFLGENRRIPLFNQNPAARTVGMAPEPAMVYYALFDADTGIPVWEGSFQGAHEYRRPSSKVYYLPFDIWPAAVLGRNGLFLTLGENRGPEILEYDMSGSLRRIIRLAEPVVEPSREDIDKLVGFRLSHMTSPRRELATDIQLGAYAVMPLPEIMPAFSRLLVDEVGWLWAELYRFDVRAPVTWLVFGPNGEGFGSVDMPPDLDIRQIGRDFVLGVWHDELKVEYVRRHALTGRG